MQSEVVSNHPEATFKAGFVESVGFVQCLVAERSNPESSSKEDYCPATSPTIRKQAISRGSSGVVLQGVVG